MTSPLPCPTYHSFLFFHTSTILDLFTCYWHTTSRHYTSTIIGIFLCLYKRVQVLVEVVCTYTFWIWLKTRQRRRLPCVPSVNTNCSTISSPILSICYQAAFHPGAEQETGDEYFSVLIWNCVRPKCRYKHLTFLFPVSPRDTRARDELSDCFWEVLLLNYTTHIRFTSGKQPVSPAYCYTIRHNTVRLFQGNNTGLT